jgi:hypothetical protein
LFGDEKVEVVDEETRKSAAVLKEDGEGLVGDALLGLLAKYMASEWTSLLGLEAGDFDATLNATPEGEEVGCVEVLTKDGETGQEKREVCLP